MKNKDCCSCVYRDQPESLTCMECVEVVDGNWPNYTPAKQWTSNAEWPDEVKLGIKPNVSTDTHGTYDEAESACSYLERKGLGGMGKVFPIKTWTEPVTE